MNFNDDPRQQFGLTMILNILKVIFRRRHYPHSNVETYEAEKLANILRRVRRPWWKW